MTRQTTSDDGYWDSSVGSIPTNGLTSVIGACTEMTEVWRYHSPEATPCSQQTNIPDTSVV